MSDRQHCWHTGGFVLTSSPPQYQQTCCNCGAERRETTRAVYEDGHGPHVPAVKYYETNYYYTDSLGDQPCIPTP